MQPPTNPSTETQPGQLSPFEFADYIEGRLGRSGIFSLYALRRGQEEVVAHRNQGAESFRRVFTALVQYNRPEAIRVLGYKANQKREGTQVNFTETLWLVSDAQRDQSLYGFASGQAPSAAVVPSAEELRSTIFRDMSQQTEIQRLVQQVEHYRGISLRLHKRLKAKEAAIGEGEAARKALEGKLTEKYRLESGLTKNLMSGVGGLLMGVVASVRPDVYQQIETTLSGLEGLAPSPLPPSPSEESSEEFETEGPETLSEQDLALVEAFRGIAEAERGPALQVLQYAQRHPGTLTKLATQLFD